MSEQQQNPLSGASKSKNAREIIGDKRSDDTTTSRFFEEPKTPGGWAKHAILKSYLDAWFPIMLSNGFGGPQKQLVYVDGFAGPGLDEENENEVDKKPADEQLGSPILVYKALAEHTNLKGKTGKITLIFFEMENRFFERLEKNMEQAKIDYPVHHNVEIETEVHRGDFNELIDDVLLRFKDSPMFVFADPFGHNMKITTLQKILSSHTQASPRELFLNLMDGSLLSSINDETTHKSQDELLGVSNDPQQNWRKKCTGATPDEKLNIISEFYIRRLQEAQADPLFALKFAMKDQDNHHLNHLVYVTCQLNLLDKMKTNMSNKSQDWKSFQFSESFAEKHGGKDRDVKADKPEMAQDILKLLIEKFSHPHQENKVFGFDILKFTLIHTPYPTNVKEELKKVMKGVEIKVPSKDAFECKIFTFPKKTEISTTDNQPIAMPRPMQELIVNQNGGKNDDNQIASSSGNEPPSKKTRASK